MRKRVTVIVCDICGEEKNEDEVLEGVVHLDKMQSIYFDICTADKDRLVGEIEPSARRGRKGVEEAVA